MTQAQLAKLREVYAEVLAAGDGGDNTVPIEQAQRLAELDDVETILYHLADIPNLIGRLGFDPDNPTRRYRVHVYAIVRVAFWASAADSPEAAAKKVMDADTTKERLYQLKGDDFEFAEDWEDKVNVETYDGDELVDHNDIDVTEENS